MKRLVIIPILMIAGAMQGYSQKDTSHGVHFVENMSWADVLQKAKTDNKYVFVDCYASWCGPCKWMDKNIYVNDTVGVYMNDKFISVRIQMDSTKTDPQEVKNWYETAHFLQQTYQVHAYPTFLFFSPDGKAVHKETGSKDIHGMINVAETAINPEKQYYSLLAKYQQGHKDYSMMPFLANQAKRLNDDVWTVIASDYIRHYLTILPEESIWTKEHIQFIADYSAALHYHDQLFRQYMRDKATIDTVMGSPHYSDRLINMMAYKEEVKPRVDAGIKDSTEPHWTRIEKAIEKKYGRDYAAGNVVKGRVAYYEARKEWGNYATYFVKEMEVAHIENWPVGPMTPIVLNNDAFEVFKYSNDKRELEKALGWIDKALAMESSTPNADDIDTKANILYKIGRKKEGLALEEKAYQLDPKNRDIEENYNKMKNGQPTWEYPYHQ